MKEQVITGEKRLQAKEEETAKYRAKAEPLDKVSSNLAKATNYELRGLALELIKRIRDFANEYDDGRPIVGRRFMAGMMAAKTEDERKEMWGKMMAEADLERRTRAQQYTRRLKVDILLMRDELRSRIFLLEAALPDSVYEFPLSAGALETIATDLETLAKKLPP